MRAPRKKYNSSALALLCPAIFLSSVCVLSQKAAAEAEAEAKKRKSKGSRRRRDAERRGDRTVTPPAGQHSLHLPTNASAPAVAVGMVESSGAGAGSGTGGGIGEEARRCGNEEYEVRGTVCSRRGLFRVMCCRVIMEMAEKSVRYVGGA